MRNLRITTVVFGLAAIAVGIWRQLETGTSPQAAWFGIATGVMAIAGACLLSLKNRIPAYALIIVSLCFVSGWFLRRVFSGHSEGFSPRIIIILAACTVEFLALLWTLLPRPGGKAGRCQTR